MSQLRDLTRQWLNHQGVVAPLLLTGADSASLAAEVDFVCRWSLEQNLIHQADLTRCGPVKNTISIQKIRQILNKSSYAPLSQRKLIIIEEADKLSRPAGNALLKSLEDSHPATRFLLTTMFKRSILPTILSRCQKLFLAAVPLPDNSQSPDSIIHRTILANFALTITDQDVQVIALSLCQMVRAQGPTPKLKSALCRIRDYYKIKSARGNTKLAKEVLLASLP